MYDLSHATLPILRHDCPQDLSLDTSASPLRQGYAGQAGGLLGTGSDLHTLNCYTSYVSHAQSFEAIVLKTYDVGEADRLCVLFTRERGRLLARASGARRTTSKLGASLLPFRHLTVELKEGSAGWIVAGVSGRRNDSTHDIDQFTALEEGIELLLRLVTDEGSLPDVFDVTLTFLDACRESVTHASLGYSFALLHRLGLLPEEREIQSFQETLTCADHRYLQSCREGLLVSPGRECHPGPLCTLKTLLLDEQIRSPLKAAGVIAAMA